MAVDERDLVPVVSAWFGPEPGADALVAQLECGHRVEVPLVDVVEQRGGAWELPTVFACPTCLAEEREEIVAELPGAD